MPFCLRQFEKIDLLFVGVAGLGLLMIGFLGWWLVGAPIVVILLSLGIGLILLAQVEIDRRHKQNYRQIEAMLSVLALLRPKLPLPQMRDWAISPDFARIVVGLVLARKPKTILECGSGVSTLLMAYCIRELGQGHIWSLEHDPAYGDITRKMLEAHDLGDASTIIDAPLKEISLYGRIWKWYDTASLGDIGPIDLLVIDGPPQKTQRMARYPALPVLGESLNDDAIVILDDASGRRGKPTARAWKKEFVGFECECYHTEKGALLLRKTKK